MRVGHNPSGTWTREWANLVPERQGKAAWAQLDSASTAPVAGLLPCCPGVAMPSFPCHRCPLPSLSPSPSPFLAAPAALGRIRSGVAAPSAVMDDTDLDWVDATPAHAPSSSPRPPDHSSAIASKLLQGWTLLADSCPNCLTPLVRNRQKQLFCVSCSQWLLTQDQLALKLEAQHVHDNSSSPSSPHLPPSRATATHRVRDDGVALDERSPKRLASTDLPNSGKSFNDTNMTASPSRPSPQPTSNLPKVQWAVASPRVLSNTVSTLYQKLEELRQAIAACQDVHELNQLLGVLSECMQAIQKAQGLFDAHPDK